MDTLLVDQPSILAPEDETKLRVKAAVAAALATERERFIAAAVRTSNRTGQNGAMQRAIQRVYPDVTNAEWYARRDGRPWPPDPETDAGTVDDRGLLPGCTCVECQAVARRMAARQAPIAPEDEALERTCSCESCDDETCQGECDSCDYHNCEQCYPDHSAYSCCGWCEECQAHAGDEREEVCDRGHCHECEHYCRDS